MSQLIEGYLGHSIEGKKSKIPAKLDYLQSASGLFLGLFMWAHMIFVSSILISKDAFNYIVHLMELRFIHNGPLMSYVTSIIAIIVLMVFVVHALLAMRKFPINWRQYQLVRTHFKYMKHSDSSLWMIQAITGFMMFFLASFHLVYMVTNGNLLSADMSANRFINHFMWFFYAVLLVAVELHGGIGLYRLCVKWGWFEGKDAKESRKTLKKAKWIISVFFLVLGILSYISFVKLGYTNYKHGVKMEITMTQTVKGMNNEYTI